MTKSSPRTPAGAPAKPSSKESPKDDAETAAALPPVADQQGEDALAEGSAAGLGLTPNETVGWRIRTDDHNYTVVLVRRHAPASKFAGKAYDIPLAYCKSLSFAVDRLIDSVVRAKAQGVAPDDATNGAAHVHKILDAISAAKQEALAAVRAFECEARDRNASIASLPAVAEGSVATGVSGTAK